LIYVSVNRNKGWLLGAQFSLGINIAYFLTIYSYF